MANTHQKRENEMIALNVLPSSSVAVPMTDRSAEQGAANNQPKQNVADNSTASQPPENVSGCTLLKQMGWRKRLTLITACLVNFSSLCCFAVMAPFLPLEADAKGVDSTAIGMIFACFELVLFTTSIFLGRFMTEIGARFMYISGVMMAACCCVLFGMLQWCPPGAVFLAMAFACRLVEALGCAMCQTASIAILSNEFKDRVATVVGLSESFAGLGLMGGPAIGGALYELGGFYLPFVVLGVFFALTGVVAALILPKSISVAPKDRTKLFLSFIKIPAVIVGGVCTVTCSIMMSFLDPVLSNQLAAIDSNLANSKALIGLVFLVLPGLYALLSPFIGYLSDVVKHPMLLLTIGNIGFVAAYLLLGPCPLFSPVIPAKQLWLTIVSLALLGIFVSFCLLPTFSAVNSAAIKAGLANDLDLYGLLAGYFGSAFNLGAFIGSLLAGFLVKEFGFEWAASIIALAPFLDLFLLTIYVIVSWKFKV